MDMKRATIPLFLLSFLLFTACNQKGPKDATPVADSTQTAGPDTLAYTIKILQRTGDSIAWKGGPPSYSLTYPEFSNVPAPLKDSLAALYSRVLFYGSASPDSAANAFVAVPKDIKIEDAAAFKDWFYKLEISVPRNNKQILTLAGMSDEYTGGAHGMHTEWFTNIDRATGKTLQLPDVVVNLHALAQLNEQYFKKEKGITAEQPIKDAGLLIEGDTLPLPGNFTFTATGLWLQYNLYEVMSYADGMIGYNIPYSELNAILKPEYRK